MLVPHLITEAWNQCNRCTCRGITRWSGYRYREGSPYSPGLECGSHTVATAALTIRCGLQRYPGWRWRYEQSRRMEPDWPGV